MATLFNITTEFINLFNNLDELIENEELSQEDIEQAWFDTLESVECEFDGKAENIAVFIKQLVTETKALKAEEQSLKQRRLAKDKTVERLKNYLKDSMQAINRKSIDCTKAKITIRNNAESVVIDDEQKLIEWAKEENDSFLVYKQPEISKTELKNLLSSGQFIPFAHLQRTQSIIIK